MESRKTLESACKQYEEDLVLHYYGEISEAERSRVDRHLSACGSCRRFLEDLRGLLPQITRAQKMPETFWDNYYRETVSKLAAQDERKAWWRSLFAPMRSWMVPAFGTVAAAVLVVGLVIGQGNMRLFFEPRPTNIPQEILADKNQLEFFESLDMLESLSKLEAQDDRKSDATRNDASLTGGANPIA